MAKKLHLNGYRYDPSTNTVFLDDNILAERLLLITNVGNNNDIIYNFADSTKGYVQVYYDQLSEETQIQLSTNCISLGHTANDALQILVENHEGETFSPTEDLLDAVGKLRVSNPGNLIDTDFEYGLQSTKWETSQLVNNIPTVYAETGGTPVEGVTSVTATAGSKQVKVITTTPHGLSIGNPISVQGVSDYQAEGFFIISGVSDTLTFFFELDVAASTTGDISGSYTTLTAARFFEGSPIPVSTSGGAKTDAGTPSTITVTTDETHGFQANTKLYVRNTVGPKTLELANSASTANEADGRPTIDTDTYFTLTSNITSNTDTGRGTYQAGPVVAYDWESTHSLYLSSGTVNAATDQITWTSHGLYNNFCLLFNTPRKGESDGGMTDGTVYYVTRIDDNTFELYSDIARTSKVNLTTPLNTYGLCRLGLVYRIYSSTGQTRRTMYTSSAGGTENRYAGYYYMNNPKNTYSTRTINLSSIFTNPIGTVRVNNIYTYGDLGGFREFINHYFNYNSPARNYSQTRAGYLYPNLDLNGNSVYTSGSTTYMRWSIYLRSSVSYIYYRLYLTNTYTIAPTTEADFSYSGSDLYGEAYGAGLLAPDRIIAFQGDDPSSSYTYTNEQFSYLINQREKGRHGTIAAQYNYPLASTDEAGSFNVGYNSSTVTLGNNSEVFYVFSRTLTSARNTIYAPNHGIASGATVFLVIPSAEYAAGERFIFSDSTGNSTTINQATIEATVTVVTADIIKVTLAVTPNTDDIQSFPSAFSIEYRVQNSLYNSIYILNHKISGTARAQYFAEGNDEGNRVYQVTADGSAAFLFTEYDIGDNISNPPLTLYRGETYRFDLNASGHPFYFTTDNGAGYSAGSYVGEYTTGVSNSRSETGNVVFAVGASTPHALYYQCGVHALMNGTVEIRDKGVEIGGLSNGQFYEISRATDSRITLRALNTVSASNVTGAIGAANNNTVTYFVDIETPLGSAVTTASITKVEFRGDFGNQNEYVVMSFSDGDEYFVGTSGQDTSNYLTEGFFGTKNISQILKTEGGKVGFDVTINPTSQVNFGRYLSGNKYYEIRFTVSGDAGTVTLNTASTSGKQEFIVDSVVGAYDGVFPITTTPSPKTFTFESDFKIPRRHYDFISSNVDTGTGIITLIDDHNLVTGEELTYSPGQNDSILTAGEGGNVFAISITANTFALADSSQNALNNSKLSLTAPTGTHTVRSDGIVKLVTGTGLISVTANGTSVTGTGTSFLTDFKRFDDIYIPNNGYIQPFTVDQITTDSNMTLYDATPALAANVTYQYSTQLILRPDGYSLHLPFDGGVDITAGTSPNSKITRQTRKYFRYQSGKGIQNSVAINFNPAKIMQDLIKTSGNVATVNTQEAHNLKVGDEITIDGAVVTTGNNYFNGDFAVSEVGNDFQFKYVMEEEPTQAKAGGFPTYVRKSWLDSYVRTGMFDDQNGFFWEFDGQKLYCVRRSSTLQIAGSVNVTRGSQVVEGVLTSFTTQLSRDDKVVIRGQTYQIVEVSSDLRMVVQPAYRGVTAAKVKVTKTVDTRIPQEEWNLDVADGTGPSGFVLDTTKIQMAYSDFSWYGAGKIRFGFKDQKGHVKYVHEFRHNNRLNESYFRSGNLPGRYEIENGPQATTAPTLFHFGTSVIMDGTFDDDKAYLFTRQSRPMAYTNGGSSSFTSSAVSTFEQITLNGKRVYVYSIPVSNVNAAATTVGDQIRDSGNTNLPEGSYVTQIKVDGSNSKIYTNYPALATQPSAAIYNDISSGATITVGEQEAIDLTRPLPLVSLRLAPSVDSSLTGSVGEREIINRMQLALKQAGITTNQGVEVFLILNALPSALSFEDADKPSLSEIIEHSAGETLTGGTTILATKASAGSVEIDLAELLELGNSILGGDGIFPAGPDLLTVAVQPQSTASVTYSTPFEVSGKISWSESQA